MSKKPLTVCFFDETKVNIEQVRISEAFVYMFRDICFCIIHRERYKFSRKPCKKSVFFRHSKESHQ